MSTSCYYSSQEDFVILSVSVDHEVGATAPADSGEWRGSNRGPEYGTKTAARNLPSGNR